MIFAFILMALSSGCSVSHKVKDNSTSAKQTRLNDSTNVVIGEKEELSNKVRNVVVENTDSTFLKIKFENGGIFDIKNGVARGVSEVETNNVEHKLSQLNELLAERCTILEERIIIVRDSLKNELAKNDIDTEVSVDVQWWVWLLIGAVLMFALIVVLKKSPQTSWLLFWL